MPELPEVETTRLGIIPHLLQQKIIQIVVRQPKLRWPVDRSLVSDLPQQTVSSITRRGKYLLLTMERGTVLIHLGMSGRLSIIPANKVAGKHDHIDFIFVDNMCLRFTDPRRFGAVLWTTDNPLQHPLLVNLGKEPLAEDFTGEYLFTISRKRKVPIKQFIMESKVVVGVGNIYANEALFAAKIHPRTPAASLNIARAQLLVKNIKIILNDAIMQGGTTLRDFRDSKGKLGYFFQKLKVYGRADKPCMQCRTPLKGIRIGQRSTVFCPNCQK